MAALVWPIAAVALLNSTLYDGIPPHAFPAATRRGAGFRDSATYLLVTLSDRGYSATSCFYLQIL
jgi:hypothetical protein